MSDRIDQTDAKAYVGIEAASRIEDIGDLIALGEDGLQVGDELGAERLEALGLDIETFDADDVVEAIDQYPLCVEASTMFEIVLGIGGPDSRLVIECDRVEMDSEYVRRHGGHFAYEIRRVLFRYSWEGSAEIVLGGEDRETAETLARRVVPELSE
jgi:hypothetical protein